MQHFVVTTARGKVVFTSETRTPDILLIGGFKRQLRHLLRWYGRLPGLGVITLPGMDVSPELDELSVAAWAEAWREALRVLPSPPVVIGESLGAMVAMCLPARAVVAVEPLLSVDQLWPQHQFIRVARARGLDIPVAHEALFEQSYDWVLDRIAAPTLVIAGDMPLLPERRTPVAPSLLSDADFARYAAHPLVEAHRIAGGHTLLDENPQGVLALATPFLARHAAAAQSS